MKSLARLAIVQIAFALAVTSASAQKIYWTDMGHDKIRRANLDGSGIEELVTSGLQYPGVIAVDPSGGKMYWTDWVTATSRIQRANLDGTGVEDLVTGLVGPWGIALDTQAGKMYWTEFAPHFVRRANLDGSDIEDLITAGPSHPMGIALDVAAGKMYVADGTYYCYIWRASLDGTNLDVLVNTGVQSCPMEIELDLQARKMYWTALGSNKIQRADLDGANVEDLITGGFGTFVGLGLDPAVGKMYYSDSGPEGSQLRRANLDGTGIENIVSSGIGSCYGLTLDLNSVSAVAMRPTATITLSPANPNPFTLATLLRFRLATAGPVELGVFDVAGRRVCDLVTGQLPAGGHTVVWDGRDRFGRAAVAGTYLAVLRVSGEQRVEKLSLVK